MSLLRYIARRAMFALVSVYLVLTVTFALITLTLEQELRNRLALARYDGASPEALKRIEGGFAERRNLDEPWLDRYVDWLVDVATREWGYSFAYRKSVVAVLDGRVQITLEYVLPGVVLAILLGVVVGLFAALTKDGSFDWSTRLVGYALLGIPSFMFIIYYLFLSRTGLDLGGGFTLVAPELSDRWLASVAVATSLLAGMIRFSRTAALEQSGQAFVKLLRAKGASRLGLARHVLRNAALPIVSLSFSELIAILMLDIYVIERVLGIEGLAAASLKAALESDVALVIWTTMVLVFIGIAGNFVQDVLYGYLDPRVRTSE